MPAAFDIETSSFRQKSTYVDNEEKVAIMYEWTFAIFGLVTYGRTWQEFIQFYEQLTEILGLSIDRRLIIYVHNLSYEFQFFRKYFEWHKIFSLEERKPVSALTIEGIEFRCSYKLSGYSLDRLGKQLLKYKVLKLKGGLDYKFIRHSETPLTEQELQYCICDVLVVNAYIQELIEREGDITAIQLTKTGFVRKRYRQACLYDNDDKYHNKFKRYRELMKSLTLDTDTYDQLKRAFAGGFTHASPLYAMDIVKNVKSYDFTSSYPYVMVSEKFPMTKFERVKITSRKQFNKYLKTYNCLFDIEINDLESKLYFETYISASHCFQLKDAVNNNGRVVSASHLIMTITECDYMIIKKFYKWKSHKIFNFKIAHKEYLPTDIVTTLLSLYEKKTTLKDVEGFEIEYLKSKEDANSTFGMAVTDPCRDEIIYNMHEWNKEKPDKEDVLNKYNNSVKRFLYYAWGVWVTAYARLNLFTGILEFKEDYLYSDTDSIKVMNYEKHEDYIKKYNNMVLYKLQQAANYHGFDISKTCPKTKEGIPSQLGVWKDEGIYTRFKSLGAKRYMTEHNGVISLTVSGLNKKNTMEYLHYKYGDNIFENFKQGLYIPAEYTNANGEIVSGTGKNTHTYIDEERHGIVEDYLGNIYEFNELSGIHLEGADYDFSITSEYIEYLLGIKQVTIN